jgi:hypothetical protein
VYINISTRLHKDGKEWEHKGGNKGKTIDEIKNLCSTFTSTGLTEVPKRDD